MTKISKKAAYPIKKPIKSDYFIGSDSEDFGRTVNFDFKDATAVINELNGQSVIGYQFKTASDVLVGVLEEAEFYSLGNETTISDITKLYVNKFTKNSLNLSNLYNYLLVNSGDFLFKLQGTDPNVYVYFNLASIENHSDYYIFNVTLYKGNAVLPELISFGEYFFNFELKSIGSGSGSDPLKLDKDGYTGTAKDIDDRILVLENLQDLNTNFTGQAFAVWTGEGYVYDVIYPDYYIQGVLYPGATQQITLEASDAVYSRFDVIYVNASGAQKATGDPALNPLMPTIDEGIDLFVTSELVVALSTAPVDSSIEQVYNENIEWTTSSLGSLVNFNATNRPSKGIKNADIVNAPTAMFTQFTTPTTKNISDFNTLKFDLFFVENYGKTHGINVYFLNGSTIIGSYVIKSGLNNYKFGNFGAYQSIVVDFSSFTFTGVSFDTIKIVFPWANAGFSIDNVVLVKGSSVISPTQKAITTIVTDSGVANATISDDTFTLKGGNGASVSAVGKVITITPVNQTKSQVGLGNVDNTSDTNKPISTAQQAALDLKLDASAYNEHFKGKYTSSGALTTANPTATDGDYAIVDAGMGVDAKEWIWDNEAGWIVGGATGASTTDALPEGSTNLYFTVGRFLTNLTLANIVAALGYTPSTAPNDAQKNSNITKAEIEAKLTGEITTHTHPAVGGGGDMVLASTQTVSGLKTFLSGMFGLRNVANTFTSFFTNSNTASRTYTLPDRSGTLADNTDIASINTGKMNTPAGTANYLSKFLTATTIGLSRLWDTGTFLGIGTVSSPTKDLTFGNQTNREVGIEESNSLNKGMDLFIRAGRTINYAPNSNFNLLTSLTATETVITVAPNGNVYLAAKIGDIYMQTAGTGNFVALGQTSRNWYGISAAPNGNVYATNNGGDIYMQTGGLGNFVALGQTSRNWYGISAAPNGNVYAVVFGGDIYMQTAGTGNFVALGQTSRNWWGITVAPNGNVYACGDSIGVYMQTSGSGTFNSLGQASKNWRHISAAPSGNVYAAAAIDNIYMQTAGTGNFVTLGQSVLFWFGIAVAPNGNVYVTTNNGQVYIQYNFALGNPNLDGGTYKAIAGTGKGTGKSRYEVWTGQKTVSGTDMQTETLREYIDENGYHIYTSMPVYADDAAADADTNLPSGASYKLTGNRTIFHKP